MSITDAITAQIESAQQGDVFFVSDFAKSGNDVFISRVLSELISQAPSSVIFCCITKVCEIVV
ncbi:hypothetical protein CLI76_11165 [Porphyromonas gingivalis]|nr:hypothetical protein CLI76_11165 [Porphyromonas gingivalis]